MAVPIMGAVVSQIMGIVGKAIKDPAEMARIRNEALVIAQRGAELEAEKDKARAEMLGEIFKNKSRFVSGAIPAWIWLVPVHVAVTHWVMPILAAFGLHIDIPMEMPAGIVYASAGVVAALLGKKVADDNEWRNKDGNVISPAKKAVHLEVAAKATATVDERFRQMYDDLGKKDS